MTGHKRAHGCQFALSAIFAHFVRVTTTLTLIVDFLAFAVRQVTSQVVDATSAPVGQRSSVFVHLAQQATAQTGAKVARAVQLINGAHIAACWAINRAASFLFGVQVEATVFAFTLTTTGLEATVAALFRYSQVGRQRQQIRGQCDLGVQLAVRFDVFEEVLDRIPQALTPFGERAISRAISFFVLNTCSSIFVWRVRMTAAFTLAIFFDAVALRQTIDYFLDCFATPFFQIRAI